MNNKDRPSTRRRPSDSNNAKRGSVNNDARAFMCIVIGFLTITTMINTMYHRKFMPHTDSARWISSQRFKQNPRNNSKNALVIKPSSKSLANKGGTKEELGGNIVSDSRTFAEAPKSQNNQGDKGPMVEKGQVPSDPAEISKAGLKEGKNRQFSEDQKVSKNGNGSKGGDVPEDRVAPEARNNSGDKVISEDQVIPINPDVFDDKDKKVIEGGEDDPKDEAVSEDANDSKDGEIPGDKAVSGSGDFDPDQGAVFEEIGVPEKGRIPEDKVLPRVGDDPDDKSVSKDETVSDGANDSENELDPELRFSLKDDTVSKNKQVPEDGDVSKEEEASTDTDPDPPKSNETADRHIIAGLSCSKYGGPSDEIASEMVYWSDIPSDSSFASPFKKASDLRGKKTTTQYITFEPDGGGWNNIRMAMETIVVMAFAMGRTLVLPPAQGMYLLGKLRTKQNVQFSFAHFFHLESVALEHAGIDIITTEEFLLREAMTGNIRNKTSGEVSFPPNNRTKWDGENINPLKEWLREVALTPTWRPPKCMVAFPSSPGTEYIKALNTTLQKVIQNKTSSSPPRYLKNPTPVDAPAHLRLSEHLSERTSLCFYDEEHQNASHLHFMCNHKLRVRLMVHFYGFLFFEDWKHQLWSSRFVRDHLRYGDELQCAAARVIEALKEKARENYKKDGGGGGEEEVGAFDAFHVRRGDFQYKRTRINADELYKRSKNWIPPNATLFVATDERNKKFFGPLEKHYHVYYLDHFEDLLGGLNTNYYGMIDQLVASKSRTFVGTYYSTFSGYINRMRGYHSQKSKSEGYEAGLIKSYYFFPDTKKNEYRQYAPLRGALYSREFPVAWRDIDKGIKSIQ